MSDSVVPSFLGRTLRRRSFLRVAGATAASSALVLAGCGKDDNPNPTPGPNAVATLTLTGDDNGLLNFAYLLEQIEAAFYQKVVTAFPADFTAADKAAFIDLRDHEVIHREFFKSVLAANAYDAALPVPFEFNFTAYTLTTRAGVYAAARTLEDLGVAAYNGLLRRFSNLTYLRLLAKIGSVEARHAAFVRDQAEPNSFAGPEVIVASGSLAGLSVLKTPTEVAALIAPLLPVVLVADNLMLL
ncbi:Tat (twin-arginine translocation) pathway signal sequence containing protein [Hymenobacter amundsenii]|uniref:Tat (Twin-arginine translocation) pathway signal sequence containing protein n=1 Tax=Hymenobacter amundsenii TaxID=2006685 RepID=A0A246FJA8_9BACT|nr:ferritin-like domain-containing protein [Hymenobacter amundsenii]OWP62655.1 Tat (twin-arginine translocation) pathway signal sequence containing protein [Hymenobacter amundsenii]